MSWDEDAVDTFVLPSSRAIPGWPIYAVFVLAALAIGVAALLQSFISSVITYGVLLLVGCGLLFYRRRLAIAETRRAGGMGFVAIQGLERIALGVLALACLANGLVIAFEMASWDWGF